MKPRRLLALAPFLVAAVGAHGCASNQVHNIGTAGSSAVAPVSAVTGTVFTIVMENKSDEVVTGRTSAAPFFNEMAARYASAGAYISATHPSEPNYITLTSGTTHGIGDDGPPAAHSVAGTENLADQLETAHVPWRAYMEDMGTACNLHDNGNYAVKHDPFVFYSHLAEDTARCQQHVVDFDSNFSRDLASNAYRYMWVTPNMCNDMHNCSVHTGDEWLRRTVTQIMASPGYLNGGVIFVLFDEGSVGPLGARGASNLPTLVISEHLAQQGYRSNTTYGHPSYLATVEDIFGMPRLPTTRDASPMRDFFTAGPGATASGSPVAVNPSNAPPVL